MVALGTVHRQALQFELAPVEGAADRPAGEDCGLDAAGGHGDIGQGQQAPATAQAGLGPVETEAMLAQEGAGHAGGDAEQGQGQRPADHRNDLMRENIVAQWTRAICQGDPESAFERIEAEDVAEGLGDSEQARDHRQRKIEQAGRGDPAAIHGEQRRRIDVIGGRRQWSAAAPGADMIAKRFGTLGDTESLVIPEDLVAVSVELTDPARVAGFVNPGSEVAIFVSGDPLLISPTGEERQLPAYTSLLLPKIQVIGVGTTSVTSRNTTEGDQQTIEEVAKTILTLAVDQEQAEKLIFAARNSELAFALLSADSKVSDNPGVTARDIMPDAFRAAQ